MRRALAITVCLLLALSLGTSFFAREALAAADQVQFRQEVRYGDVSAAEGLVIDERLTLDDHLFWDLRFVYGEGGFSAETGYSFNESRKREPHFGSPDTSFVMYDYIDDAVTSDGTTKVSLDPRGGITRAFSDLMAETPSGTRGEKTVRLADYYQYYPLSAYVQIDEGGSSVYVAGGDPSLLLMNERSGPEAYFAHRVHEFFRIPVPEDQYIKITVFNSGGVQAAGSAETSGYEGFDEGHDAFSLMTQSAASEDAIYFWFGNRTNYGDIVDTSLIPGGYGIYRIPIGRLRFEDQDGNVTEQERAALVDGLSLFYPVDEEAMIQHIWIDKDGKTLILHVVDDNKYYVDLIDAASGDTLRRIDMGPAEGGTEGSEGEDPRRFGCLYEDEGEFELVWGISPQRRLWMIGKDESGSLGVLTDWIVPEEMMDDTYLIDGMGRRGRVLAFDGSRLAVCGHTGNYNSSHGGECGHYVYVFDDTGLRYSGVVTSTLDDASKTIFDYSMRPRPLDWGCIEAVWR